MKNRRVITIALQAGHNERNGPYLPVDQQAHSPQFCAIRTLMQQMYTLSYFKLVDNREKEKVTKIKKLNDQK